MDNIIELMQKDIERLYKRVRLNEAFMCVICILMLIVFVGSLYLGAYVDDRFIRRMEKKFEDFKADVKLEKNQMAENYRKLHGVVIDQAYTDHLTRFIKEINGHKSTVDNIDKRLQRFERAERARAKRANPK